MARANRLSEQGGIFHVTHRCHNQEFLLQEQLKRDPCWTESLAVGSAGFLERIRPLILSRQETELVPKEQEVWVLQESVALRSKNGLEKRA